MNELIPSERAYAAFLSGARFIELVRCLFTSAIAAGGQKGLNAKLALYGLVEFKFGDVRYKNMSVY